MQIDIMIAKAVPESMMSLRRFPSGLVQHAERGPHPAAYLPESI